MTNRERVKEIKNKDEIKNRKIAIYFNNASMSPVVELHTAMILDLLSRGNQVTAYACDKSFKSPMDNPFNRSSIRSFTLFRIKDALKGLPVTLKIIDLTNVPQKELRPETAQTIELGIMSSYASMLKIQSKEELTGKWIEAYQNMLSSAKKLYTYFTGEIETEKYEMVFMFNGRFGDVKPVLQATRDSGIGYGLYEMKKSINEVVFINELVHSIGGNTHKARGFYEKNKTAAEQVAHKFFERKIENKETGDPIYTKQQTQGSLPDAIKETNKKVIAIYPSTEDEYKFIGKEWDGFVPESQIDEIEKLALALPAEEYILIVKMHPNQENTGENILQQYLDLEKKYPHVVVEKPMSEKDTYALMNRADFIVTFASTIGVEACYAGKPVILIGDTNWGQMDVAHKVYSGTDAGDLIKKGVGPKPKEGAIVWGNYLSLYRDKLPEFRLVGKGNFYVGNRRVGKSSLRRIWQLPAKLEISVHRPGFSFGMEFVLKIIDTVINIVKGKWTIK